MSRLRIFQWVSGIFLTVAMMPARADVPRSSIGAPPDRVAISANRETSFLARILHEPFRRSWSDAVRLTTDWWRTYRTDLELSELIGDPSVIEPQTWVSIEAASRDLERYADAWRYQSLRSSQASIVYGADPHALPATELYTDQALGQLLDGSSSIVKRHLELESEIPDVMAYLVSGNARVRESLSKDSVHRQMTHYGWLVPLGMIAVGAARDQGSMKLDVNLDPADADGQSVDWRTQISEIGLSLEPRAQSGLLLEFPSLRVEALAGARASLSGIGDPRLDFMVHQKRVPRFLAGSLFEYARWASHITVPLTPANAADTFTAPPGVQIQNALTWSRATAPGAHLDVGINVVHELEGAHRTTVGAGWTSPDALTRVFSDISLDVSPGSDDGGNKGQRSTGLFFGIDRRY